MNIDIPLQAKVSDILNTVKTAEEGGHIYCSSERHFSLLKICLIKLQKTDLSIYQLDQHGFTIKQVSARRKDLGGTDQARQAAESMIPELADSEAPKQARTAQTQPSADIVPSPSVADQAQQQEQGDSKAVPAEQGMNNKQISAVRDLEQALRRCKELELLVVGFSDGLVAVPETLGHGTAAISSAEALEVESFDVYRGYEADDDY